MLFPFPQVNKVSHSMYPLFNPKRQEYKCIFYGETAYDTLAQLSLFDQKKALGKQHDALAQLFNDNNDNFWGTKFF